MLMIRAHVKPSPIHGIGVFAEERIPKGTITWKFDPRFDLVFDPAEVETMPAYLRDHVKYFSFLSKKMHKYVYATDDSRFTNHATDNNIDSVAFLGEPELCGVAKRDIEIGEELTADYRLFDVNDEKSSEEYLNNSSASTQK